MLSKKIGTNAPRVILGLLLCFIFSYSDPVCWISRCAYNFALMSKNEHSKSVLYVLSPKTNNTPDLIYDAVLHLLNHGVEHVLVLLPDDYCKLPQMKEVVKIPGVIWASRTAPLGIQPHPMLVDLYDSEERLIEQSPSGRVYSPFYFLLDQKLCNRIGQMKLLVSVSSEHFPAISVSDLNTNVLNDVAVAILSVNDSRSVRYPAAGFKTGGEYMAATSWSFVNGKFISNLPMSLQILLSWLAYGWAVYCPRLIGLNSVLFIAVIMILNIMTCWGFAVGGSLLGFGIYYLQQRYFLVKE